MRKKIFAIGAVLLLVGAVVMICGIIGAGSVVEEKTYKTYSDTDPYGTERAQQFYEFLKAGGPDRDPTPPLIDPVIILGTIVAAFGVVFLVKSKDEDFLPGI